MTEVEERLAVLLGVPVPTAGERVLEGRRLSVIGQVGKMTATVQVLSYETTAQVLSSM